MSRLTRDELRAEFDRLSAEIENMRRMLNHVAAEEEEYSLPTVAGIVPLELVRKRAILHAVAAVNGDVPAAAKRLGIGRTTLYRKLKEYGAEARPAVREMPT